VNGSLRPLPALGALLLAALAGGLGGWWVRGPARGPEAAGRPAIGATPAGGDRPAASREAPRAPAADGAVERRLAETTAALADLAGRIASLEETMRATPPPREPAGADPALAELRRDVLELWAWLEDELRRDPLADARAEARETDWAALEELAARWRLDPGSAANGVRLSSEAEVLRRFGPPTELWSDAKGTHWTWRRERDPATGAYRFEVYVRMDDGRATMVNVTER